MTKVTRRSFIAAASVVPFSLWAKEYAFAASFAPRIRYDALSANGSAMLKIYADGVKAMQAMNTGNPQSWKFQWYTHCIPGSAAASQQTPQKNAAIAAAYPPGTPAQKAVAQGAWNTCQAHYSGLEDYFLPWHRMYVLYLEEVIRKVTGEPKFTLPYWNYSVAGPNHGVMPKQFRLPADPIYKFLFVQNRSSTVNAGAAIDANTPGTLALTALSQCNYSRVGSVAGFCETLDGGLHGNVHVLIGDLQNMGAVPWAARDPIFWMHHCNIDRLWASWNKAGRSNPSTPAFTNQAFTFGDGNGSKVVTKIGDVLDISALNYTYDHFEHTGLCRTIRPNFTRLATSRIVLGPGPVETQLKSVVQPNVALKAVVPRLRTDERIYLVLKNLTAADHPGVVYHVFLGLPAGADPKKSNNYEAGVINFFNAVGHGDAAHDQIYSFDVTDVIKRLGASLTDEPKITIVAFDRPNDNAQPVVGEASLVRQ